MKKGLRMGTSSLSSMGIIPVDFFCYGLAFPRYSFYTGIRLFSEERFISFIYRNTITHPTLQSFIGTPVTKDVLKKGNLRKKI